MPQVRVWGSPHTPLHMEVCMSEFITGCCRLISGIFGAVYSEPLLAFFMTVMLVAVVAGLFLYIYRGTKRL